MSFSPERGLTEEQQARIMLESFERALVDISENWEKYKEELGEAGAFELKREQLQKKKDAIIELMNVIAGGTEQFVEMEKDLEDVEDALEETDAFIKSFLRKQEGQKGV